MSDEPLANRCRQFAAWVRAWDAYEPGGEDVPQALNYEAEAQTFDESAAEIERLQAALADASHYAGCCPPPPEAIGDLRISLLEQRARIQQAAVASGARG